MILALVSGGGVGAGAWLVVRGWAPPRPTLSESLARLRTNDVPKVLEPVDDAGWLRVSADRLPSYSRGRASGP